jgi:hypothetical protein
MGFREILPAHASEAASSGAARDETLERGGDM